jgi:predicted GIY-YIG superfamily endonuclease
METTILQLSSKDLRSKSGIYMISCNQRSYIGSSKSLYDRLLEHRVKLINGYHSNDFMQKAFNKYGITKFKYKILEFCNPEERIKREKWYIDNLKPEFNLQLDPILKTLSIYSKQKLSKSIIKGRSEGKYKTKFDYCEIEQYDYFGNYLTTFKNKEDASKQLKISFKIIQNLTGGYKKGLSRKGIRLRYSNSKVPVQKFKIDPKYLGKHFDFCYDNKIAFSNVKDAWKFFSQMIESGKYEFTINIKIKGSH